MDTETSDLVGETELVETPANNVAMVDANGEIRLIIHPSHDEQYVNGEVYGDQTAYHIPWELDTDTVIHTWYWDGENFRIRAPRPSDYHDWDGATATWAGNVERAIAAKRAEINEWKETQRQSFDWNGHRWDSDENGRVNIMGVVIAGIAPPSGYWTSADNVDVPITTVAEMQSMYQAMVGRASAVHDRQRAMKIAVEAMTDVEAVLGYVVGWG